MRIDLTLFLLGLGVLSLSAGQQESPLDLFDENDDGKLSFREFSTNETLGNVPIGKVRELFGRLDRDNDGFLAGQEVRMPDMRLKEESIVKSRIFVPGKKLLKKIDVNEDGFLSFQEYISIPHIGDLDLETQKAQFGMIDADLDQRLTLFELRKARKANNRGLFKKMDTDNNGTVTTDEFAASRYVKRLPENRRKRMFKSMDQNGDGVLNLKDLGN